MRCVAIARAPVGWPRIVRSPGTTPHTDELERRTVASEQPGRLTAVTPYTGGTVSDTREDFNVGVLRSLVDFRFTTFSTPKLIRIGYAVGFVVVCLGGLVFFLASLTEGGGMAVVALLLVPVVVLFYLVLMRVGAEMTQVLFRMAQGIDRMANDPARSQPTGAPSPAPQTFVADRGQGPPPAPPSPPAP